MESQFLPGQRVTSARLSSPFQLWVPVWTNLSVVDGSVDAGYREVGGVVHWRLVLEFLNTVVSGAVTIDLPVAASGPDWSIIGGGIGLDFGTPANRCLFMCRLQGSAMSINFGTGAGTGGVMAATMPFTWASQDILALSGSYLAA